MKYNNCVNLLLMWLKNVNLYINILILKLKINYELYKITFKCGHFKLCSIL